MAAVKFWFRTAISLAFGLAVAFASADQDPVLGLKQRLHATDGVEANFHQQVSDAQGFLLEDARGRLLLKKPNIRWEVVEPFPQTILVDAEQVRIYDPDLEQVTERDLEAGWEQVPLTLLTQADLDLNEAFRVQWSNAGNGVSRYLLIPRSEEALFQQLEVYFDGTELSELVITDHVLQVTSIRFSEYRSGQVIESKAFKLELPPGTEIVRG